MVFIADEGGTAGAMGNETYQLNVLKQLQNHLIQMFLVFKKVLLVSFSFFFFYYEQIHLGRIINAQCWLNSFYSDFFLTI